MFRYTIPDPKPQLVLDPEGFDDLESQLQQLDAEFKLREVELTFKKEKYFFGDVGSAQDVFRFVKNNIQSGIEVQEHFVALFLNQANRIIGYYHHSMGTINSTQVDIEVLAAAAVKILAKAVIVAHNHPSGKLMPSEADRNVTRKLKAALQFFDIHLLDHLIVTNEGYYSFAEQNEGALSGLSGHPVAEVEKALREEILKQIKKLTPANAPNLYAIASSPQGYLEAEEMIVRRVLKEGLPPVSAIPLIEQEMDML
ncbi:MAG: JAB domain-containing protein [Saprospiraceae bacterium]